MEQGKIKNLSIMSLESEYSKTLSEIHSIKENILGILNIKVPSIHANQNNKEFLSTIVESIQSLNQKITDSEYSKELGEKDTYLQILTTELELRRKELFNNLDTTCIPLDKLSTIERYLSDYTTESYKEEAEGQIHLAKTTLSLETNLRDIFDLLNNNGNGERIINCCKAADITTVGQLLNFYIEYQNNSKAVLRKMRNLGKGSMTGIQIFLKEQNLI